MAPKIEKNIPIPLRGYDILKQMEVGDSALFEFTQSKASTLASGAGKKLGFKFTTRKVEGGYRIWRIE